MTQITVRRDLIPGIVSACLLNGVPAPTQVDGGTGGGTIAWTPDLSSADQATVQSIVKLAVGSTLITKAERDILEPDFVTLRAYAQNASPTNAQSVAAIKSLINFVRAIVND